MIEDDNLTADAGVETLVEANEPSEGAAKAASEKDTTSPPTEEGAAKDETADAGDDAGDKPKKQSGSARKAERIRELEARIAELEHRTKSVEPDAPPKLDDFPDWDTHQVALAKYAAKQAVQEATRSTAETELAEARQAVMREAISAHLEREKEARERIPDYDKKLKSYTGPAPRGDLAALMIESDKSALLAIHLADRPELVRELNNLPPTAAARRIGQIEARLSYSAPKTASNAPPPVGALKGGASASKDPASMSHDELKRMFART
jgi:hypothetical protein